MVLWSHFCDVTFIFIIWTFGNLNILPKFWNILNKNHQSFYTVLRIFFLRIWILPLLIYPNCHEIPFQRNFPSLNKAVCGVRRKIKTRFFPIPTGPVFSADPFFGLGQLFLADIFILIWTVSSKLKIYQKTIFWAWC